MFSAEYRWFLLHPLLRGVFLTLVLGCVCIGSLLLAPTPERETAAAEKVAASTVDQRAAWPRTVLRLWFLAPHILPLSDR